MQITDTQVKKFQLLYKKHFSIELSEQEAKEKGSQLTTFVQQALKPLPKTKLKRLEPQTLKPLPTSELPINKSG